MSETNNESNSGMLAVSIISAVGGISVAIANIVSQNKQKEIEELELAQLQEVSEQETIGGLPVGIVYALLGVFVVLIILGLVFRKK